MSNNSFDTTMTHSSQHGLLFAAALFGVLTLDTTPAPLPVREDYLSTGVAVDCLFDYSSTWVMAATYANPRKKNFRERYARMATSSWFKRTYENKSVGDLIAVDY